MLRCVLRLGHGQSFAQIDLGKVNLKCRPQAWLAVDPNIAVVLLNDPVNRRETEAAALAGLFGCEKRLREKVNRSSSCPVRGHCTKTLRLKRTYVGLDSGEQTRPDECQKICRKANWRLY